MAENEGGSEQDDVSFLRTEDMVCLSCNATGERVCLAAEGFGNRTCFLEGIADRNKPPDLAACVFVIEQALSVRALQELVTAAASDTENGSVGKGTGSGHRTLLYGNAVLLRHQNSDMYLACLSTSSSKDKLAFDVGLQEHCQGEACWWTIHPASKQRSEGEKVRVGDDLILVSVATERYLQATLENEVPIVNASFHVTHWSVSPFGTGLSRVKYVGYLFGGEVLRFFHGGDECLTIPSNWSEEDSQNIVVYEGGSVVSQARSLWRLELARTKWSGGYINWFHPMRIRHITTGRYLGINEHNEITLIHRSDSTVASTTFYLREEKDDNKVMLEDKDLEVIGTPLIKYGDSTVIVQHIESGLWLSYKAFETKKKGVGKVEVKQAILHEEGKMDDGLEFSRSQDEESRTARVIRKCSSLFTKFTKQLDQIRTSRRHSVMLSSMNLKEIVMCLEDLINYFAQPDAEMEHEERQIKLRALRNRQDLCQEEGILNLILDAIDKITVITSEGYLVSLAGEESGQMWDIISNYLYQLLAAMIKGNHNNCAQFANSMRLNWLFSRLGSQAGGEGMLDVLHCVLIDSPEALNVMKEEHIKVIISILEKHGRDPKVLDVLRSLCVGNGVAVRSSQNNICDYLLPGKSLLLQTALVDHVSSVHPNIYVGKVQGSSMYLKWYYEVTVDHIEQASHMPPHLRMGWANTMGYIPYPGGGEKWGGNGVGDDLFSFGFDGAHLWTGGRKNEVFRQESEPYIRKNDVIGVMLDLTVPSIEFTFNGEKVLGCFRDFNLDGMFFPVISCSSKLSARFLLGGDHGRQKFEPPEGFSPVSECLLPAQQMSIDPCFHFGELAKGVLAGPLVEQEDPVFVPQPIDTSAVSLPHYVEQIRDRLAENIHEIWAMNKIDEGWRYGEERDDEYMLHPCLTQFERLPPAEKRYDIQLALQTLKTIVKLGYHITLDKPPNRIRSIRLPNDPFMQSNGYKPAPLDLSQVSLTGKLEELVEKLAENTHMVWSKERIQQGWTYGLNEDMDMIRTPHLVPYRRVDEAIKKANRDTASEAVRTLLVYGYILDPPSEQHDDGPTDDLLNGRANYRTYRAEKTYAVSSGKWYFEFEVLTDGPMKVGWARIDAHPGRQIGQDDSSWAFDGYHAHKHHSNQVDLLGRKWHVGDVVGCMLDLHDRTISFSLNGELMMDAMGGETAFSEVAGEAFVPACTLGLSQRTRLAFGHDVNALKFFTQCGLQEGYEPFCVNMTRPMTFWYTKDQPIFENVDEVENSPIDVTRIPAGSDSPPCLRISHATFETLEKANWEFLRLSLPVTCQTVFIDETEKERRWHEIRVRQHRLRHEGRNRPPSALKQSMLESGFTMSDIKDLQNGFDAVEADEVLMNKANGEKGTPAIPRRGSKMARAASEMDIQRGRAGKEKTPQPDGKKKERGKSPFRFFKKRDQSTDRVGGKRGKSQDRVIPTLELPGERPPLGALGAGGSAVRLSQADMRLMPPQIPDRLSRQRLSVANAQQPDGEPAGDDIGNAFDAECLRLINEYYYGVRIFPGQDPAHVYVGWVTTQYHIHGTTFSQQAVRKVTVAHTDGYGQFGDSVDRHSCYMVRADDLLSEVSADASGKGASQGMSIGCFIDTSTGVIAFTCEGKETNIRFKMEPGVKLFPAVFVEATSKDVLQIELGRTPTSLPLSAAVLQSSEKHVVPQFPPRLKFQLLKPHQWARVPNQSLRVHALKLSDIRGWSIYCEDPVPMLALHIPEEDRCIDILELIEHERLLSFHAHTLELYCAVCFQSNYRGAHILCHHVDDKQLLYAIRAEYMSGPLRRGFYDLLIAVHMESHANTMEVTSNEYVIPLGPELKQLYDEPGMAHSLSVQTTMSVQPAMATLPVTDTSEKVNELAIPYFDFETVRVFVMEALKDAYVKNQVHTRDSIGGSNETLFVPLLKLCDRLLLIGYLRDEDIQDLLVMIDHASWDPTFDPEGKDQHRRGLLQIKMAEGCKLQICYLLHHLYDIQLRHRVESIVAFSHDYVGELQRDQLRRYVDIKQSELPSSVTARKTKEFRCPPREQMNSILSFKNLENIDPDDVSVGDDLIQQMKDFHDVLMKKISIVTAEEEGAEDAESSQPKSMSSTFLSVIGMVKQAEAAAAADEEEEQSPEDKFRRVLVPTIVRWAEESFIEDSKLIREMFRLLLRQYNAVGELMKALEKTYVINAKTSVEVASLWNFLSKIRALLPVQMSPEEEELVRKLLWSLVNNHVFFQHPDLVRILRIHENVMAIMMNTLARRSQAENESASNEAESKDTSHEMVVACCRFLCYFCRTSRQNQKAMFDHLQFLLENSNILLSRPSLRGSTPLDVSYSSLMDNTELALALREHYLEKIAVYLSRCGLQSNSELVAKGYPDLGWDPVEGERYLDFLRFCVWVGGESVEENANLVIRLLIRRPECLGPALRGEGEGLLNAINQANKMAERIDAQNNGAVEADGGAFSSHPRPLSDDDEDYINTGAAILNFYCTLVDVMGRSSPEEFLIEQGKNESLRARAILRSLVPLSDLEGVLSLPFTLRDGEGEDASSSDMPAGLIPSHKQSVVLFLERVYGIEDRELFFRLLEFAFLPDLRAATVLDKSDGGESDMGLALNRYIGNSILPLLIKHSRFYADADNYSSLLDATLHTVYRLSKNKILTKGQREAVSDFLVTLTRELHPGMMLKLLRKLTVDVSNINEYTTVALRLLTLHYDRCGRYYGSPNGQGSYGCASEEEKRLTMILFSNIFDSLAKMEYDPDLFGNALPCLTAIGCALPPDYSLTTGYEDELFRQSTRTDAKYIPQPIDTSSVALTKEMVDVIQKFSDHYHDAWASRKLENGWFYGEEYNREERTHPRLKPPYMLSEYERERYREPVRQALTALLALGWTVEYGEADTLSPKGSIRRSSSRQDVPPIADSSSGGGPANYNPQPVDMTNLTLSREMQNMAERLAENAHDIWAKKTKHELEASAGASAHPQMVPYDLLTDKEKRKDRERCQELLKYLQFQGYKLARARTSRSDSESQEKAAAAATERRFAYSLLEKLQQYLGSAALNMKVLVPSQNLGHRVSFKRPSRDVKFFFKVVLPLMEKYFSTNRSYFIAVPTVTNMVGAASLKEKEMVANVFCKLAHLLRMKMSSFSSDTRLAVRCLTVLVRAVDARSLAKQCPEFVRTSMLTFFNHAAEDVGTTVQHLQECLVKWGLLNINVRERGGVIQEKYSYIRGTHLKTSSCLNYVQLVLFPVLTAFFDHLVVCEYGTDLLLDEIQVACYKLFHGLYQLGTDPNLSNQRKFIKAELDRHRPSLGTCLGAFAACFPVAFLEPDLNKYNQYSIHGRLQERSLEAQEVMARLEAAVPTLEEILKMVEKFAESGGKYDEARHIVDSLLPMLCAYLPFWWSQGPDNAGEGETQSTTRVTDGHMNQLLKNILHLIKSNIGSAEAPWMTRIAGYAQQIIVSCSPDLLYDPYLPLAEKVRRRTEAMYHKEENLRGFLKSTTEDTSQVEGQLQEMWYLLVRDIYAFYPLLIKYVDLQRSHWLKDCVPEAEDLYNHVAVIFEIWSKSQYFTREETNFISQNEIDNMTLIRPTTTARRTTAAVSEPSAGRGKKKKKRGDKKKSKDKDVASSLMVACLKRLLPVGLNLFAGREQEMVQHAKDRYLKGIAEYEIIETTKAELTMPDRLDPTDSKSWQHHLYSKLGGGARKAITESDKTISEKAPTVQDIVQRIVDMAKVLYGLHMIDHPQLSRQQVLRSVLSVQRKRAVIQCFRQASLHQMTRHRAVNLFLQTYSNVWLSDENSGQEVLIEDLTQSFEDSERNKKTTKEEDEEEAPDPVTQLVTMFSRQAQMEQGPQCEDALYMDYAVIMAKSCGEEEEEGGDEEEGEEGAGDEGDTADAMNEQEIEKQKLLFCQDRLSSRGVAEMVLLNISASKGQPSEMTMKSLDLGISILRGGNVDVQMAMLNYLKEKKDSSFFVSISGLMSSCSVLDLDAFERNTKAEGLGVGSEGAAGEKNMHDDVFTCAVFRFLQLTCEGHNLDWQNYLRSQAGNTTTVNLVICTVDYLLRLQESIMDFYWHYSSKEIIDQAGKSNFFKAIGVASQVFNTLTEVIQGPCVGNQQALAHSRLWDAVGGFLFLFSHMQDKLSRHASQVDLLRELLNLQQDMIIMMLSMLEGNVVNGTIGKQMVDTLVESASNVEMILKFFDMFLKLKDLTESTNFQDIDQNNDGMITPKEFKDKMEQTKAYTSQEINFLIMCCDENHDGKIDYLEFTERFHNPAKEIGFNLAVLLTNLSEHMPNDPRLARFLETAGSVLNYFEPLLGRIEILGGNKKIERVYFEIKQEHIEQWEKPQIKQSKRDFFYQVVTEGGDKEKLELFVNFCEDAIFEMQHATSLMGEEEDAKPGGKSKETFDILNADEEEKSGMDLVKSYLGKLKDMLLGGLSAIAPANLRRRLAELRRMTAVELLLAAFRLGFQLVYYTGWAAAAVIKYVLGVINALMQGERLEKPPEKKEDDVFGPMTLAVTPPPPPVLPLPEPGGSPPRDGTPARMLDESGREMSEPGATPAEGAETTEEPKSEVVSAKEAERREIEKQQAAVLEEKEDTNAPTTAAEPAAVAQVDLSEYVHRVVSFLARNFYNLKYMALVLAFCINFMLLFYKASALLEDGEDDEESAADLADQISGSGSGSGELDITGSGDGADGGGDDDDEDGPEWIHVDDKYFFLEHVVRLMSIIHSIVSLFMLVAYYHLKVPLGIFKREKEVCRKLEFDGLYLASQPEDDDLMAHWDKLVISAKMFPANYWDKFVKKRVRQKYSDSYDFDQISNLLGMEKSVTMSQQSTGSGFFHFITSIDWRYQLWKIGVTFTDNAFLYSLWYFVFSILGNYNYFFFAAHLLDVAVAVPSLKTILQSVTHNGKQLCLTLLLLTIVVYIYTVIAFNFFRKFYVQAEDDNIDQKCHDMFTCFVFHLYQGVRAGGGIGDVIDPPDGDLNEVYRILFDISFFFFVIVILLAIIQGLIIDAFGELRDQLESVKEDMESNCFICGIGKDYFDNVPHGFETHVQKEHNLANYMFFLMHLINKDETEYTGQETYVWTLYQQRSWDFFPVGDCFRKQYEDELTGGGGGS
ncbi:ryanodine receptor-like isoform X5 [Amphibalanus amphitrite]|uniref:ryanodine receptor-like isoform X5 n=1 Tax=Amphibalanus amphitrite TaxID=1232801 RepID=UPI001C909C02|nr:ryanodine receptor-like isoform X5 [Amphibalanus amphitrite]